MSIKSNVETILRGIPKDITLVAASKTRSLDEIQEAFDVGIRDFGENKVQEFMQKYDECTLDVRWHFIGHLQTNKVKYLVGKVALIHSLDSIKLLQEIEKKYRLSNETAQVLVQINVGREESKYGIYTEDLQKILNACQKCTNVKVLGLMAIIPKGDNESCKKYFQVIKRLWNEVKDKKYNNVTMKYLSMGMTADYLPAIEKGSNMIRIGKGIFGKRTYMK